MILILCAALCAPAPDTVATLSAIEGLLNSTCEYVDIIAQGGESDLGALASRVERNFDEINSQLDRIISAYRENSSALLRELPLAFDSIITPGSADSVLHRLARPFWRSSERVVPPLIDHDGFISDDINSKFVFVPLSADENAPTEIHFRAQRNMTCHVGELAAVFLQDEQIVHKMEFSLSGREPAKFSFSAPFRFDKMILKAKKSQVHDRYICMPSFSLFASANNTKTN